MLLLLKSGHISRILNYELLQKHKSALVGCVLLLMADFF